jgi:hypothetical protein
MSSDGVGPLLFALSALRDGVALLAAALTLPLGLLRRPGLFRGERLFRGELRAFRSDVAILFAVSTVVASPGPGRLQVGRGGCRGIILPLLGIGIGIGVIGNVGHYRHALFKSVHIFKARRILDSLRKWDCGSFRGTL